MDNSEASQTLYRVQRADAALRRFVPARRGPIRPIPGLTMFEANEMKVKALTAAGLDAYNECWTFEPKRRPIPFVSTDRKPAVALEIFKKYIPNVLNFLLPRMEAHTQTYNKVSSAGWPINSNPETRSEAQEIAGRIGIHDPDASNKFDLMMALFPELDAGDISRYEHSFGTIGGRLQYELPDKEREYLFIDDDGRVYKDRTTRKERTEYIEQLGGDYVGSRYRGVLNPALINLYIQNFDTMLHGTIMKFPLCDSNVYTHLEWPSNAEFATFDCKHYERYMGMIVFAYAEAIGGRYGEWLKKLASDPFLVVSDTKKSTFLITPNYSTSTFPQLGSGIACVATVGKLTNICAQVDFFVKHYKMNPDDAVPVVMNGDFDNLRRWMYGDDNRLQGTEEKRSPFIKHMSEIFDIEEDERPKYLGTVYDSKLHKWLLPRETFHLKYYLRERDYHWYSYPYVGSVERRKTFSEYGEPIIVTEDIPYQDELFNELGHPYQETVAAAIKERREMESKGVLLSNLYVTDKEYLMSTEEQLASGRFWGFPPERTREIVLKIVSEENKKKLRI